MNIDRINDLADLIEKQPHGPSLEKEGGFNMENYFHRCGTPSCIAGWACAMAVDEYGPELKAKAKAAYRGPHIAWSDWLPADYLGLDRDKSFHLFAPDGDWSRITPSQAAATLRHLAKTGEVDWSVAVEGSEDA